MDPNKSALSKSQNHCSGVRPSSSGGQLRRDGRAVARKWGQGECSSTDGKEGRKDQEGGIKEDIVNIRATGQNWCALNLCATPKGHTGCTK